MCIRDREYQLPQLLTNTFWLVLGVGLGVAIIGVALAWLTACLLYTSDAADERSSVDLGGRRIIKKKTTERNLGRRQLQEENKTTPHASD